MSRDYYSVDLPRTSSPFALKEAVQQAITAYESENEKDIVAPKPTKPSNLSKQTVLTSASSTTTSVTSRRDLTPASKHNSVSSQVDISPPQPIPDSKYDNIAAAMGLSHLPDHNLNKYTVWNASVSNMRVCPVDLTSSSPSYYYIKNRALIPSHPGVTLHHGTDKTAPTVGLAHLDYFSTSNLLGLGDPQRDPTGVLWEKLHKDSFWTHMRYSFSFEWDDGVVKKYEWHRTKNLYFIQDQGDLVLVEEGQHDVLAEYKGKGFGQVQKQRGSLDIVRVEGEKGTAWEKMVILSWASIVELHRRRTRERRVMSLFGKII